MTLDLHEPAAFDSLAEQYHEFVRLWDEVDPSVSHWIARALDRQRVTRALDVGCGTGRYSILLAERADTVRALDPSIGMLTIAQREYPSPNIRYCHGELRNLSPAVDGQFDYVLSVRTLHHTGNQDRALEHIRSMVSPRGRLVVVDMVDPGGWDTVDYHKQRAVLMADYAAQVTSYPEARRITTDLLLHPMWLSSVVTDIPLTREDFRTVYRRQLPGAVFYDLNQTTQGVVWDAQADHRAWRVVNDTPPL